MRRLLIALTTISFGFGGMLAASQNLSGPSQLRVTPFAPTPSSPPPAPKRLPLKVVTYNIASGAGGCRPDGFNTGTACYDWKSVPIDLDGIAAHILEQAPDITLLQEVHSNYIDGRQPIIDQPQFWVSKLHMNGQYFPNAKAWSFWGTPLGSAGEMILSKYPIVQVDRDDQPFDRGVTLAFGIGATQSPRSKLSVVLDVNGTRVRVASLHQSARQKPELVADYINWMDRFPEPAIIAGDFNLEFTHLLDGDNSYLRSIDARYAVVPNPSSVDPCGAIDWILVRRGQLTFTDHGGWGRRGGSCDTGLSDHPLVYGTVALEAVPIFNPGFENNFDQWSVWSPEVSYRAIVAPTGATGVMAAVQYGTFGFIWRDLPVTPGREYDISAQVACPFGTAMGKLTVHDTMEGAYQETPYSCVANAWTQVHLRYRANATGRVRAHFVRGYGTGVVMWDDLKVVPATP